MKGVVTLSQLFSSSAFSSSFSSSFPSSFSSSLFCGGVCSKQSDGMNLLFPPYYFNMYFKKDECEKKLMKLWKTYANHPKMIIQMLYLQCVRQVLTSVFYLFLSLSLSHTHTHFFSFLFKTQSGRTMAARSSLLS